MSGYRSYEGDHTHEGKSDFGLLLLRLRKRHGETVKEQGDRLGYSPGYLTMAGSKSGEKLGKPSHALRMAVVEHYPMTTNERECALGREPLEGKI